MKATNTGSLNPISDCSIFIPGCGDELNAGLIELNASRFDECPKYVAVHPNNYY